MSFRSNRNRFGKRFVQDGITYRSKVEAEVAKRLPPGAQYENRKVFYTTEHTYTPDFELPNGVILEVKGYWSPEDRAKLLAVKKCNPDLDIRMIFQNPITRLNRTSKICYADWCDKQGIPWASANLIPPGWFR